MARPSKLTARKLAKIDAVLADGGSSRAAAEAAGVSHTTVNARAKKRRRRGNAPPAGLADVAAEAVAILEAPPVSGLQDVVQRLSVVRGLIGRLTPLVEGEEYPATSYVTLCKYADDLARAQVELTPPAPKDPNEDPDVIESERILVARVEKMIEAAEEKRAGR